MSKLLLLHTSHFTSFHRRTLTSFLSRPNLTGSPLSSLQFHLRFCLILSPPPSPAPSFTRHNFSVRAFDSDPKSKEEQEEKLVKDGNESGPEGKKVNSDESVRGPCEDYPTGELQFEEFSWWKKFNVKLRMLIAFPWERVPKDAVLTMKLRGQISEQLRSRFSSGLSLPQICENFIKAAYDPRISGIYLHIETLSCGWGKVDEIRRHILDFKKSGKFVVAYAPACREKEYYLACACDEMYAPPSAYFSLLGLTVQASFFRGVLDNVGVEPQVQKIGKYKSAADQLIRKTMPAETCEMLTALLDNIYGNWLDKVSSAQGKTREDLENFINEGVYKVERLKEEGWITNILYDDEVQILLLFAYNLGLNVLWERINICYGNNLIEKVLSMLRERLGMPKGKKLPTVEYRRYSGVRKWTLGLSGGKDQVAVIRASGSISRVRGPLSVPDSGIVAEQFIEKIRSVRESKKYKAAIIRIDSPGGDALASDLMWREIRLLAASKPVIASMSDVAASGGYYMAMAAGAIVSENLTLTGSIGVVAGKFNLGKLYEKIGFNKELISRGRFAELLAADNRPFRPDEAELFAKSAQNAYEQFRDKAALCRSMPSVTLVELSRPSTTPLQILSGIGSTLVGVEGTLKQLLEELTFSEGVQARMDGIMFQRLEGNSSANPIFALIKDYLSSL
ncbi:Serine protease SPPA, chloroplastic [Morella rubra]|uniref:Serine protease SPPA, chloroplastic n=1 Tax=Morella rubra TaxID=262757 RepID=A0A6A1VLJ5_9ROSI|nr:Serine protease SPPA, chloroplastic [Morella rubra]